MNIKRSILSFIPDDWLAAWSAFAAMLKVSMRTPRALTKQFVGIALPLLLGFLASRRTPSILSSDFVLGYLAVLGVLAGFVVTLMLFTGSIDGTQILNADQAVRYEEKIYYMLFSQTLTLGVYLIAILTAAIWLLLNKGGSIHYLFISPFVFGTGTLATVRSILLPAQIFERHEFVISAMVEMKKAFKAETLKKSRDELLKSDPTRL